MEVPLQSTTFRIGGLDDPGTRTPELLFRGSLLAEVTDDRRGLIGSARRDPRLERTATDRQIDRQVEGLHRTGIECRGGGQAKLRGDVAREEVLGPGTDQVIGRQAKQP